MSCLPELFTASKSTYFPPNKVGGPFSLHLRSAFFAHRPATDRSLPSDTQRYRSWMDSESSFKRTKRSSRSFFHKDQDKSSKAIEQRGHSFDNINGREHQQSEVEAISNFNVLKKTAFQTLHLSQKIIEQTSEQSQKIKTELQQLKEGTQSKLQNFKNSFLAELTELQQSFKLQRRESIKESKTIAQQVNYLNEEMVTAGTVMKQSSQSFDRVTRQFF